MKQHPAYKAAKAGDDDAAMALVLDAFNPDSAQELGRIAGHSKPTLVSAHALERDGVNAIPEVCGPVGPVFELACGQGRYPGRRGLSTGANGFWRLARQAEFDGPVQPGREYVLVDDFVGMGGTLANLKGYIESHGGRVVAAVSLTGKPHSAKLALTSERLHELRTKHGQELESWWLNRFAHTFDALTESEARYLARTETADTIRDRIAASE